MKNLKSNYLLFFLLVLSQSSSSQTFRLIDQNQESIFKSMIDSAVCIDIHDDFNLLSSNEINNWKIEMDSKRTKSQPDIGTHLILKLVEEDGRTFLINHKDKRRFEIISPSLISCYAEIRVNNDEDCAIQFNGLGLSGTIPSKGHYDLRIPNTEEKFKKDLLNKYYKLKWEQNSSSCRGPKKAPTFSLKLEIFYVGF